MLDGFDRTMPFGNRRYDDEAKRNGDFLVFAKGAWSPRGHARKKKGENETNDRSRFDRTEL